MAIRRSEEQRQQILQRFGDAVRRTREGRGLSQEKLAALARLDRTYVGGIERGERNLALLNIAKIAKALGVPPSTLVSAIDPND
jgi:transcriptional regulator with XRE-family HTH domain